MGGEWPKTIGEHGEDVVAILLNMLGWGDAQKGVTVRCSRPQHHASSGSTQRQNHGIDYLYSYKSQLCDDLGENLFISSKYTAGAYPNSPAGIYRGFCEDLAQQIHCYKKSEDYGRQIALLPGCSKIRNIGVILWLSHLNPLSSCKEQLIKTEILQTDDKYDGLYLIDNNDAAFLHDAISFVRGSESESEVSFTYIDTGKITDPTSRRFNGKILPVEYATLGLLPFKCISKADVATLILCCAEPFTEDDLGRLVGLSQSISQGWAAKIRILFPDYSQLNHAAVVARVKNAFADTSFTAKLSFGSFRPTLHTLPDE